MKSTTKLTKKVIPLKKRILYISLFIFVVYFLTYAIPYCSSKARRLTSKGYKEFVHKRYGNARDYYSEAIEIDPTYEDAYFKRGEVYFRLAEHEKAISDFTKAIELKPSNTEAYFKRGRVHHRKYDYNSAILDYSEALRIAPNKINIYFYRGLAYEKINKEDKAIEDFRSGCELGDFDSCGKLQSY